MCSVSVIYFPCNYFVGLIPRRGNTFWWWTALLLTSWWLNRQQTHPSWSHAESVWRIPEGLSRSWRGKRLMICLYWNPKWTFCCSRQISVSMILLDKTIALYLSYVFVTQMASQKFMLLIYTTLLQSSKHTQFPFFIGFLGCSFRYSTCILSTVGLNSWHFDKYFFSDQFWEAYRFIWTENIKYSSRPLSVKFLFLTSCDDIFILMYVMTILISPIKKTDVSRKSVIKHKLLLYAKHFVHFLTVTNTTSVHTMLQNRRKCVAMRKCNCFLYSFLPNLYS